MSFAELNFVMSFIAAITALRCLVLRTPIFGVWAAAPVAAPPASPDPTPAPEPFVDDIADFSNPDMITAPNRTFAVDRGGVVAKLASHPDTTLGEIPGSMGMKLTMPVRVGDTCRPSTRTVDCTGRPMKPPTVIPCPPDPPRGGTP